MNSKQKFKVGDRVISTRSPDGRPFETYILVVNTHNNYFIYAPKGGWDKNQNASSRDLPEGTKCWSVLDSNLTLIKLKKFIHVY